MRTIKITLLLVLVLIGYGYYSISSTVVRMQDFSVQKWDTIASLRTKLSIDLNPILYKIALRMYYRDNVLQSGSYHMTQDVSLRTFFTETIREPESQDVAITLLPGWNIFDIDASLAKSGMIRSWELRAIAENIPPDLRKKYPFLAEASSLEGFLLPDTYRLRLSANAREIIDALLTEFWKQIYDTHSFASSRELYDTLILASIVEKEEKVSANKPVVAGILKKRNDAWELIGADATVCYAYRLTMSECTPAFIGEHVYTKTAYNTRMKTGLPPTPISNPSAETFSATAAPEPSPYYYYLHDDTWNIHYGRTLEEHNANRVRYLGK